MALVGGELHLGLREGLQHVVPKPARQGGGGGCCRMPLRLAPDPGPAPHRQSATAGGHVRAADCHVSSIAGSSSRARLRPESRAGAWPHAIDPPPPPEDESWGIEG